MAGAYAYTPDIWPPLAAAFFLAAMALYCWRRRDVPAARPLAANALFGAFLLLVLVPETAAVHPATQIAWHKLRAPGEVLFATAALCFVLEYTFPGRWLTRRNLTLLALPPLLLLPLIAVDNARLIWSRLEIGSNGSVVPQVAAVGKIVLVYGFGLVLVNLAALLWLFVRSPQHRWPAALILFGQTANRAVFLFDITYPVWITPVDLLVVIILLPWTMYAIALFGFRMFDPRLAARRAALEQMRDGMVAFDPNWRVASLNRAAAAMLGTDADLGPGRTIQQLLPALPDLCARLLDADHPFDTIEISLGAGAGAGARTCSVDLSTLRDFRGLVIGRLLMLHDLTEQRRAEARLVDQQRTLAVLQERERLARELHDSLGQVLAAAHLQANSARLLLSQGQPAQADECLGLLVDTTLAAEADVRDYLLGLKSVTSADRPFFPALREYLRRFSRQCGLPVTLVVPPELEALGLPDGVEVQLLRIIQEALSNVRKHARARGTQVIFLPAGANARVAIVDDGQGFDPAAAAERGERYGLQSMRERAEATGGSLAVLSSPGQGTQIVAHVPMKERT